MTQLGAEVLVLVRGFGFNRTHYVKVPRHRLQPMAWPSAAYPFTGIDTPVKAICGISVRSVQPAVMVLTRAKVASCSGCRRMVSLS